MSQELPTESGAVNVIDGTQRPLWKKMDYFGFAYAAIVASGGVYGYVKSGSTPSMAAGLLFGSAIAYGAYQVTRNQFYIPALAASTSLGAMMSYRFFNSGKFMPAGLLAGLSIAMTIKYSTMAVLNKPMRS